MKKSAIIIGLVAVIVGGAWWGFVRVGNKSEQQELWLQRAVPLAGKLEKRTAGNWLKKNAVKRIDLTAKRSYHPDTLFVKFSDILQTDNYIDGVLLVNWQYDTYTDTGAAFILLKGIAGHIFDGQKTDYGNLDRHKVDKVRLMQYVCCDAAVTVYGEPFNKLLQSIKNDYDVDSVSVELTKIMGVTESVSEQQKRLMNFTIAAAFNHCADWTCRMATLDSIEATYHFSRR